MIDLFNDIMMANDIRECYGTYFILWIISLLYLLYFHKEKSELVRKIVIPAVLEMLVITNPLCAIIINKCLQGSFWRVYWILNIFIVIACVGTYIIFDMYKKHNQCLTVVFLVLIIFASGHQIYTTKNFQPAGNEYKIPQYAIEVCDVLKKNDMTENVALDKDLAIWVRQYDATIKTTYGRFFEGKIGRGVERNNIELLLEGLEEEEWDCLVIAKSRNWENELVQKGYQKCAETELHDVWKAR